MNTKSKKENKTEVRGYFWNGLFYCRCVIISYIEEELDNYEQ